MTAKKRNILVSAAILSLFSFLLPNYWLLLVAALLLVLGFTVQVIQNANHLLMETIQRIGGFITRITFLPLIFFLFLTPIALMKSWFSKKIKSADTNFVEPDSAEFNRSYFERMW